MPRKRKVQVACQENIEPVEKIVVITKKNDKAEKATKKQKLEPDWATGDGLNVIKIILSMQKSDCNSNKCINELTKLYRKVFIKVKFLYLYLLFHWIFSFLDRSQTIHVSVY